jgi:predicted GH43/DUF377 family glycosyl hydrolase
MPVQRLDTVCLLRPEEVAPSHESLRVLSVFNPGVVAVGEEVGLLVRVAEAPKEARAGFVGLPRYVPGESCPHIDWLPEEAVEPIDPRVVRLRATGHIRLTFVSHLRWVRLDATGKRVEEVASTPALQPETEWETYGVEDPRITPLDGRYYFTYVAVSPHGACTALASTTDFQHFTRHGIIFPPENKDVLLFPERIGGEYAALHRPNPNTHFHAPEIWITYSPDLIRWGRHLPLYGGGREWESDRVGGSVPPLRVADGWLEIYHATRRRAPGERGVGTYTAAAMLLHPEQPERILKMGTEPILVPEAEFEREGFVPNVVFPTGAVLHDDYLLLYYGAADTCVGVAELSLQQVLKSLG